MDPVRRFIIAYDISSDTRRDRIAKALETYGDRVQYSVFVVDARPAKLVRLRSLLSEMIIEGDSIMIADLGATATMDPRRFEFLGRQRKTTQRTSIII